MAIMHSHEALALRVRISCSNYIKIDENLNFCVSMLVQVACSDPDHQRFTRYELENIAISDGVE